MQSLQGLGADPFVFADSDYDSVLDGASIWDDDPFDAEYMFAMTMSHDLSLVAYISSARHWRSEGWRYGIGVYYAEAGVPDVKETVPKTQYSNNKALLWGVLRAIQVAENDERLLFLVLSCCPCVLALLEKTLSPLVSMVGLRQYLSSLGMCCVDVGNDVDFRIIAMIRSEVEGRKRPVLVYSLSTDFERMFSPQTHKISKEHALEAAKGKGNGCSCAARSIPSHAP
ncbi:unnamed protein product [Parajaminaea phylloscopi]